MSLRSAHSLAGSGAYSVATSFGAGGIPTGVTFQIPTTYGLRHFSLPVYADKVEAVLRRQNVSVSPEQAERVAWRIVKDWLEAQLAIIETEMATLGPTCRGDNGQTVYELYRDQQLALGPGS